MRVQFLGQCGRRYLTGRCARPDIPPIRYFFAEEEAPDGASEFVSLWQPYEGEPFIENVERLPVDGAAPGEFQPVAVRVTLAGGQVDTFFYTHQPDRPLHSAGLEFQGSFGYWSELDGRLRALHLVNGGCLRKGHEGIESMSAPFRAKIVEADYPTNRVSLDRKLPEISGLEGRPIHIRGGTHRTAYHIAEGLRSRDAIRLDHSAIIYRSRMIGIGEDRRCVICEIPPPIEVTQGFSPGYYDGAFLTGEDLKARLRISRVDGDTIHLDDTVGESDLPDADGDGRRMVNIYDFGPGDEVTMYHSAFVRPQ